MANENTRKLISKDDSGEASGDIAKLADGFLYKIHSTKQKLSVDKILSNQGLYAPYHMNDNIQYILTMANASKVMITQSGRL